MVGGCFFAYHQQYHQPCLVRRIIEKLFKFVALCFPFCSDDFLLRKRTFLLAFLLIFESVVNSPEGIRPILSWKRVHEHGKESMVHWRDYITSVSIKRWRSLLSIFNRKVTSDKKRRARLDTSFMVLFVKVIFRHNGTIYHTPSPGDLDKIWCVYVELVGLGWIWCISPSLNTTR